MAHQFSLVQIPNTKWTYLEQCRRKYSSGVRGDFIKDYNINYVPHYEEDKYDVALLHVDQQCFEEGIWNYGKGSLYKDLNKIIQDIPKIVIMHGTPYYPEKFPSDITKENYKEKGYTKNQIGMSSELIEMCKDIIGDNIMITNSKMAAKQWGFGIPFWHGLNPDDWWDLPKEPRAVTMIGPAGLDKYYDRMFLSAVKERLLDEGIYHCHITVDVKFKNWDEYRDFLGRSLIYFNHTKESPMPRARTEAMLSGCCVISTANQDSETYLINGENCITTRRNPDFVVKVIKGLIKNYDEAIKIGQAGKKTAIKLFSKERFESDWRRLLEEVVEYHKKNKTTKGYKFSKIEQ